MRPGRSFSARRFALAGFGPAGCLGSPGTKDARENCVDVAQLAFQIERALDRFFRNPPGNIAISEHLLAKIQPLVPSPHGMTLHQAISVFARDSLLDQFQQQLSTEYQSPRAFEVRL